MPAQGVFAKLDWLITPRARDAGDLMRLVRNPWSWPVMDLAMRLAIFYPIVFAVIQWCVGSGQASLGGAALLPSDAPTWIRWATFGLIALVMAALIVAVATSKGVYEKPSMWLTVFLVAGAGALAVSGALALVGAFTVSGSLAVAVAGAVTVSGAVTVVSLLSIQSNAGATRGTLAYIAFAMLLTFLSARAAVAIPAENSAAVWIIGFALLPSLNAFFDWLSYGATIWLLSRGHRRGGIWPLLSGLADIGVAFLLFAGLGLTLVTVIGLVDASRAEPLVDLGTLLGGLRHEPTQNLWIVAMVASTLLPTFLHLCLAFVSLVTWVRAEVWAWLVQRLDIDAHGAGATLTASLALTTLLIAYLAVPSTLMSATAYVLWTYGGGVRDWYLDQLANYAAWAGFI